MSHLLDLLALAGVGLVLYGLWRVHPPLAPIVGGVVCIVVAVWGAKRCRS